MKNRRNRYHRGFNRPGFTLVEMLVSAALCMFIMVILTGAFQKGIEAFRLLRASGQMAEKLRTAGNLIRRDLAAQHFDGTFQPGLSGPYLSDQRLDQVGWMPPDMGYVRLTCPPLSSTPNFQEGTDGDGVPSSVAVNHTMAMTVKRSGVTAADIFQANMPNYGATPPASLSQNNLFEFGTANTFASKWGEVSYYLAIPNPTGAANPTGDNANGRQLYTLYRRQVAVSPLTVAGTATTPTITGYPTFPTSEIGQATNTNTTTPTSPAWWPKAYADLKTVSPGYNYFNSPTDLTIPNYIRFPNPGTTPATIGSRSPAQTGGYQPIQHRQVINASYPYATIDQPLLTEVISFEIRAIWDSMIVTTPAPIATSLPLPGTTSSYFLHDISANALSPVLDYTDALNNYPFRELPRRVVVPVRAAGVAGGFRYLYRDGNLNTSFFQGNPVIGGGGDVNYPTNYNQTYMQYSYTFDTWTRGNNPEMVSNLAMQFPNLQYVNWTNSSIAPPNPNPYTAGNPFLDMLHLPTGTTSNNVPTGCLVPWDDRPPMRIRIRAIQIRLRVWDNKANLARQVTIIQDV